MAMIIMQMAINVFFSYLPNEQDDRVSKKNAHTLSVTCMHIAKLKIEKCRKKSVYRWHDEK